MGAAQADKFEPFKAKMEAAGLSEAAIAAFKMNYDQLVAGVTGLVRSAPACSACGIRHRVVSSLLHRDQLSDCQEAQESSCTL